MASAPCATGPAARATGLSMPPRATGGQRVGPASSQDRPGRVRMHVLLITIGSSGDVHPFVGVGAALRARGHRVTLVTNAHFAPLAAHAGLEFVELGTE